VANVPTLAVDDIDLSDLQFWGQPPSGRLASFALLRAERHLPFFEEPEMGDGSGLVLPRGPGYYAVTRHADVVEVTRNSEVFCSGKGALSIIDLPEELMAYFAGMISTDNPRHARLRRIVSAAFNPKHIRSIEHTIEEAASRLIDRAADLGECDFVTNFAAPLSLEIICDMMGVPESERSTVFRCSNEIIYADDAEFVSQDADHLATMLSAGHEITALMGDVADIKGRIEALTPEEQSEVLWWLLERDHDRWDEQIARDLLSGRLDVLIDEAKADRAAGKAREL